MLHERLKVSGDLSGILLNAAKDSSDGVNDFLLSGKEPIMGSDLANVFPEGFCCVKFRGIRW